MLDVNDILEPLLKKSAALAYCIFLSDTILLVNFVVCILLLLS